MGTLEINKSIRIKANADDVWNVLSDDFANVGSWASVVEQSRSNPDAGEPVGGAPVAGRVCTAPGFGDINETIVAYDPSLQTLTFQATASKIPGFVKDIHNRLNVKPLGPDSCEVSMAVTADATGVLGALMGPMMRRKFASTLDVTLRDLKTFAETGTPSQAKQRAMAKAS